MAPKLCTKVHQDTAGEGPHKVALECLLLFFLKDKVLPCLNLIALDSLSEQQVQTTTIPHPAHCF